MPDLTPGTCILYREGDRFAVARIDLVKDGHCTAFPFCPIRRRWLTTRRRIARDFIVAPVPAGADIAELVRRIECLRNQRDSKRQQANQWLQRRVLELTRQDEPA
jgi:hypothetical protein